LPPAVFFAAALMATTTGFAATGAAGFAATTADFVAATAAFGAARLLADFAGSAGRAIAVLVLA
jgi:hypothetical protein